MLKGLVSVIIPCYQQGPYLGEAIESVLAQSYPKIEIVVVNDASTDSTLAIAESYVERYPGQITLINNPVNSGQAAARNLGLEKADGEYCVMLDADDLLEPEMVQSCLERLKQQPRAAVVAGNAWIVAEDGKTVIRPYYQDISARWPGILRRNPYGAPCGLLARTSAIRLVGGFNPQLNGCEDWDLWARMIRRSMRFVPLHRFVCRYRQLPQSHTTHFAKNMANYLLMLEAACLVSLSNHSQPAKPPVGKTRQAIYANGRVFHFLGLALACGATPEEIEDILKYLRSPTLNARFCGDQFLEGLHFGLVKKKIRQIPAPMTAARLIGLIEPRLEENKLSRPSRQALDRRLRLAFEQPFGKRSLAARLTDRLERTFHRSFW